MSKIEQLQQWYAAQCNGAWEHDHGVRIESVDDPGWCVRIGLRGTALESRRFVEVDRLRPDESWVHCRVRNGCFEGYGGPRMLDEILAVFLEWAEPAAPSQSAAA